MREHASARGLIFPATRHAQAGESHGHGRHRLPGARRLHGRPPGFVNRSPAPRRGSGERRGQWLRDAPPPLVVQRRLEGQRGWPHRDVQRQGGSRVERQHQRGFARGRHARDIRAPDGRGHRAGREFHARILCGTASGRRKLRPALPTRGRHIGGRAHLQLGLQQPHRDEQGRYAALAGR